MLIGWAERVREAIFDTLIRREGVLPDQAADLSDTIETELKANGQLTELFVVKLVDGRGVPHAVVVRQPPPDTLTLWRFDINGLRRAAQQEISREFEVDLAMENTGTAI